MLVFETCLGVHIVNIDFFHLLFVAKVDPLDIVLDVLSKHTPVISKLDLWLALPLWGLCPAIVRAHLNRVLDLSRDVKKLLWDTSHINASASKSPGCATIKVDYQELVITY